MQYIDKKVLTQLYLKENLTQKEVAQRLNCSLNIVINSIKVHKLKKTKEQISQLTKRLWAAKSDEEKQLHAKNSKKWWNKLSEEEKSQFMKKLTANKTEAEMNAINEKRKQTWANKSEEEWAKFRQKVGEQSKKTWNSFSEEKKAEIKQKRKETFNNMDADKKKELYKSNAIKWKKNWNNKSDEEKQAIIQKQKETMKKKTPEELQAIKEKAKKTLENLSDEEKQRRKERREELIKNRTTEQKQKIEEKRKTNLFKKHGVTNVAQLESVKDKHSKSWQNKTEEERNDIKSRIQKSCIKAWEDKDPSEIDYFTEKIFATKRKNKSWRTSKPEEQIYTELLKIFTESDIIRQYKSKVYPFHCDFYIKSIDLYIEANFHWTHGKHPFDETDSIDVAILQKWKTKATTSKFFKQAANIWAIRDVEKLNCFINNNLNYQIFYSMEEFYTWLENYKLSLDFFMKNDRIII